MNANRSSTFLRRVLWADALCTGAMGLGLIALGAVLAGALELPAELLREAGIVLLPFAAGVGFVASRTEPARSAVWAIIVINVIWVVDSFVLLLAGWVTPNVWGYAFVIGQALAVAVLSQLEYLGLKKSAVVLASRA